MRRTINVHSGSEDKVVSRFCGTVPRPFKMYGEVPQAFSFSNCESFPSLFSQEPFTPLDTRKCDVQYELFRAKS
jgi:hypothetical protein